MEHGQSVHSSTCLPCLAPWPCTGQMPCMRSLRDTCILEPTCTLHNSGIWSPLLQRPNKAACICIIYVN